jgi:AAA ATPase domain
MAENGNQQDEKEIGITKLSVGGFKSLRDLTEIEIRPLTILAGANSSGKSSMLQPILMMKQTLEASFDAGALLLNSGNVHFTKASQFLHRISGETYADLFVGITLSKVRSLLNRLNFDTSSREMIVVDTKYAELYPVEKIFKITAATTHDEIITMFGFDEKSMQQNTNYKVKRLRSFLDIVVDFGEHFLSSPGFLSPVFERLINEIIHLPGLRGNPARTYPATSVIGPRFEGTFEPYTASIIHHWQVNKDDRLQQLVGFLETLKLSSNVSSRYVDDTQVEIQVARPKGTEMVSVADVGLGVSQVLPVLVSLLVAKPGQLVYIEP